MPLISVLMPAFNAEPFISAAIRSVLGQTWPRVEVIVVNDGSRDGTLAAARAVTDPRVKVIDQENRGAAAARNRAFAEAQGDFIQHLDADDLLGPNKLEHQMRRLVADPDCVAACPWGRFHDSPENAWFVPEPFWRDAKPVDWLVACWERGSMMQPGAWLLHRHIVHKGGGWDESLSLNDDGEFFARIVLASRGVLFCPEAVAYYRSGLPTSLSGAKSNRAWDSGCRAALAEAEHLLSAEDSARTRRAASRVIEEFVYACYPAVPELRRRAWDRVRELGGPYFRPQMGPKMRAVSRLVGWRLSVRLRSLASACQRIYSANKDMR